MSLISGPRLRLGAPLLLLLAGCSGGGGGSSKPAPPSPTPVAQTISFASAGPIAKTFGDAPFTNAASGGAGTGAITYSSGATAVATVDATGQVTIVATGSAVITASKAADAAHLAANASYTVNVAPAPQTIAFGTAGPVAKVFGDAAFTNLAAGGAGSGTFAYSSDNTAVATVHPATGVVTIVGAGTAQISANKSADANYLAASTSFTLNVARAAQSLSFAAAGPLAVTYGDAPFTNAAMAVGGSGALTFASGNTSVATVNNAGQVSIVAAGSAVITATKAADNNHLAAQASYTVNVARAPQAIAFATAGPITRQVGDATFANLASGGAGSGAISYSSSDAAVAAVNSSGTVTVGVAGSAVITASKAASANHLAAQASYTVNVNPAPGIIEAPFTAWLNLTDPAAVTLPPAAGGATFSRTIYGNCPSPLSPPTDCVGLTSTVLGTTVLTDSAAGLGRNAHYWLQRDATVGRPVIVTSRRFYDAPMSPLEHAGQLWIVGANNGAEIWSSTDGRAWVQRSATTPWGTRAGAQLLRYNDRYYLIGGSTANTSVDHNDVWRSDDLLNWTRILQNGPFAARESHQVVVFDGRMWLIGGFTYDGDQRHNDVWSSTDGVTWTLATANAAFSVRRDHRVAVFNGRMWLMAGSTGLYDQTYLDDVWSSADGVTWRSENAAPFGRRRQVTTLVHNNRLYVLGGFFSTFNSTTLYSDVWSTADGSDWTQDVAAGPFGGRSRAFLLPYRNRIWLIGGVDRLRPKNESWSTTDLVNWTFEHTSAPFSPRHPGRLVSFNGRLWMLGTAIDNRFHAWSSADGDDWTQSPGAAVIPPRNQFNVAVHNNRLWVQGGFAGNEPFDTQDDVWSTDDGENWTRATAATPFAPRYANELFAMNGRLFAVGGIVPGAGQRRDVWSSVDGANWQRDIEFGAFGEIYYHQIVVFNGRAWLLGGKGSNHGASGQIWSSADGVAWQLEGSHPQATGRYQHRAVVHDNRIWIVAGLTGNYVPMNDTWYSSDGMNWTQQLNGTSFSRRSDQGLASFGGKLWLYGGAGTGGEDDSHDMMWWADATGWRFRYHNRIEVP
jgi:uncharacterized protein YjdB